LLEANTDVPRPMIRFLKEYYEDTALVGCEIGVSEGLNSLSILKELNIKKMYLVDPYTSYVEDGKILDYSNAESMAHKNFEHYEKKIIWIKDFSINASKQIESLDFCYIDGNHEYKNVLDDISNYFRLITKGGVIGGHDFNGDYQGVCRAVIEFSQNLKLKLYTKKYDWWIVKG